MKKLILRASALGLTIAAAQASDVTWQAPATISGPTDVSTLGTLFGTWAPFNGNASSGLTVNGVAFQAFPDLPGATDTFDNGGNNGTFATPTTSDGNYNQLLNAGAFGNNTTPYAISWTGMKSGDTYEIQMWVNDGRNSTVNQRTETVTGGANASLPVAYGSGDSGSGQFVIGTFVADGTGGETLTLTPGAAFPSAQFNLLQVRDLSVVPEPTTMGLLGMGAVAMFSGFRRKFGNR